MIIAILPYANSPQTGIFCPKRINLASVSCKRLTVDREPAYREAILTVKRNVTLDIAGAKYRMTSDAEEEHLLRLAGIVNERIEALGPKAARSASPAQLLAVVALGLADDLDASEQRRSKVEDVTRQAVVAAIGRIDRRLEADAKSQDATGKNHEG